jgi:hypothetical protein
MSVEVALFPGRVRVEDGVSVAVPVELFRPDQNVVPRLTLSSVNVLGLPCPPLLSHVNTMFETMTEVYGLVIVILIALLLLATKISLAVMVQVEIGVEVLVGVGVDVAVAVIVAVGVLVGISVGVLLGKGVNVG